MKCKRIITAFLTVLLLFSLLASCNPKPKTNEELIKERIETFLTAYNTGDMDTVLACLETKTRNTFQATLNLLGGLAGGLTGVDVDMSDLFSLGIATSDGDFMELEITDINITDETNATVTTQMDLAGTGTQTIYFVMVYENDGWYIQDMTDRSPNGSTNNSNNQNGNGIHDYQIDTCEKFTDGRAWVKYYDKNENQYSHAYYYGFIDMEGNILYSISAAKVEVLNIGKGSGIVHLEDGLVLIDKNGDVKLELEGAARAKVYGGGYAWIYQNKSTITSLEHLYGIVDQNGTWIEPLQNQQEEGLYDNIEYIGDGFVGTKKWKKGLVYPIWNADKSIQITLDGIYSDRNISFNNGMAFVSQSIYKPDAIQITVTTNEGKSDQSTQTYSMSDHCILFADGRVVNAGSYYFSTYYNGKIITNENGGQYYEIVDYTKTSPVTVEFTKYPISQIKGFVFNGDYGLVQIQGLDGNAYVTMIDVQGNEMISPIKGKSLDNVSLAPGGYVYYKKDDAYHIIDKNNVDTEMDIRYASFDIGSEIGILRDDANCLFYAKPNGEKLFESLKVK